MATELKCKTFADICRMLDASIKRGGKVTVHPSRPMPSPRQAMLELKELKRMIAKRMRQEEIQKEEYNNSKRIVNEK